MFTLFQSIQQIQLGMEQGIYTESDYKKLLLETVLSDQTIAIGQDDYLDVQSELQL